MFHGFKDSNRMDQQLQLQLHQCNQFLKFFKSLSHHLDHTIRTRTTLNPDHGKMHSKISGMLLTPWLSNRIAPLMKYEMRWEQPSTHKPNQFQTSRSWLNNLLLQFKPWWFMSCGIWKIKTVVEIITHHSARKLELTVWAYVWCIWLCSRSSIRIKSWSNSPCYLLWVP